MGNRLVAAVHVTLRNRRKKLSRLLTNDTSVISASEEYIYWVLAIPLAGFSAFLFDGICIGATATRVMLRSMLVASASFFLLYYGFHTTLGNHALWMAFIVYLALRGIVQGGILYRMPHVNLNKQA